MSGRGSVVKGGMKLCKEVGPMTRRGGQSTSTYAGAVQLYRVQCQWHAGSEGTAEQRS